MSSQGPFYAGYICIALFASMLVAIELGFRWGKHHELPERTASQLGVVQGSLLGTVALLLGFTFALASGRYDTRRVLLAHETNAIGTTYLRSTFLPQESGREMRRLLRDYLGQRLDYLNVGGDAERGKRSRQRVQELQIALWRVVQKEAIREPQNEFVARLVESLNETIDLEGLQGAARAARVPRSVLGLVMIASLLSALSLGYGFGVAKRRVHASSLGFCALLSCIVFTILDFDRPDQGLIRVSSALLESLHERVVGAVDREDASR